MEVLINIAPKFKKEDMIETIKESEKLCAYLLEKIKELGYEVDVHLTVK